MFKVAMLIVLGALVAAQQPNVQEEELGKPGESAAAPAQNPAQAAPNTQQTQPQPQQQPQAQQPQQTQRRQSQALHTPTPEERERGKAGKPVAAFWVVVPGL